VGLRVSLDGFGEHEISYLKVSHPDVFLNIYKVQIFRIKPIQFIVKTFKPTCFGSTEPSSGIFIRTDPYSITSTFGIPSVYNDGIYNAYTVCLDCAFNNKLDTSDWKNTHFV
jgi:hypothetical protein